MDTSASSTLGFSWRHARRWDGITRPYTVEDVLRLGGTVQPECTLARIGAERLWRLMEHEVYIHALGALSGNQALQQVRAGLKAVYVSGWQVAADANNSLEMYPDQSLYSCDSVPAMVRRINNAFLRADQIQHAAEEGDMDYFVPVIADGEAGFGGALNAFELMKDMIEAGAAAVHFEDQASALKKCGHMGGKVLVPIREFITKLVAARLASDILTVPTLIIARTDAHSAGLLSSDVDDDDAPFLTGEKSFEGFFGVKGGLRYAISRGLAFAPYADMLWFETSTPDVGEAKEFAQEVHRMFPRKLLAYNCSPSFNWKKNMNQSSLAKFQEELGLLGYKFQFVTLAGFHALNSSMFELALDYAAHGMTAYSRLQEREFDLERMNGFTAIKHQRFVGTGYYDEIQSVISSGKTATTALHDSTESSQFA